MSLLVIKQADLELAANTDEIIVSQHFKINLHESMGDSLKEISSISLPQG